MKREHSVIRAARLLYERGPSWGMTRLGSELRTPTHPSSEAIARRIEGVRRIMPRHGRRSKHDSIADTMTAVYELAPGAIGFDFAFFLVFAEAHARRQGYDRLFVVILEGEEPLFPDPHLARAYDESNLRWRFANIVVPIIEMHQATVGYAVLPRGASIASYVEGSAVFPPGSSDSFRPRVRYIDALPLLRTGDFSGLRASEQGLRYIESWRASVGIHDPMVVITLRQRAYDTSRNSDVGEWVKFANWVETQGYVPVFVPDTDSAWESIAEVEQFHVLREAAWNLGLRLALYESAFVSFFHSNGPSTLAYIDTRVKYVSLNPVNDASLHASRDALVGLGFPLGRRSFEFAASGQVLSWESDTLEALCRQFVEFVAELESSS